MEVDAAAADDEPAPTLPGLVTLVGLSALKSSLDAALGIIPGSSAAAAAMGGPSTPAFYPVGTRVVTVGLKSDPQLNGQNATISIDKEASKCDGR
eukprot:12413190-Karenia_brevis.AAC.1